LQRLDCEPGQAVELVRQQKRKLVKAGQWSTWCEAWGLKRVTDKIALVPKGKTMSWNTTLGVSFLVVGLISFAVLNLAEWLLPGRVAHIGWVQIAASIPALLTVWAGAAAAGRRAAWGARERPFNNEAEYPRAQKPLFRIENGTLVLTNTRLRSPPPWRRLLRRRRTKPGSPMENGVLRR
jgi:hypothetical protein